MLDGVDHATLLSPDLPALRRLYEHHLGFGVVDAGTVPAGSAYHRLWRLPDGPIEILTLEKPGARGGGLRLVGAPALPAPTVRRTLQRPGPLALDLYVRDLPGLVAALADDGYTFRSDPVRYELFGAGFEVDEVLLEAPLGLVHALVEYLPDRHRCVLGEDEDARCSEIVAAITAVEDVDQGLATLAAALGGQVYFDAPFHGPAVEELLDLPAGASFRTVLLRGPERRNARLELMALVDDPEAAELELAREHPHVVLSLGVASVDAAVTALDGGGHGELIGPLVPDRGPLAGRRVATLWTAWGAVLELTER